ncbi:MAG: hypothetical protein ACREFD_09180 [Stellaceae bacterium]
MIRLPAVPFLMILIGVPLAIAPMTSVGAIVAAAAIIMIVGIALSSLPTATLGALLSVFALMLSLWQPNATHGLLWALLDGLALPLFIESIDLARRFRGATIEPARWRHQAAWWCGRSAIAAIATIGIAIIGGLVGIVLPEFGRAMIAGAGILIAAAAAAALLWPRGEEAD